MKINSQIHKRESAKASSLGFTLVEMLVVIGIIGILAAVLLNQFRGSTDAAKATQCLSNMRNLTVAVQNYAMEQNYYPFSGSFEYRDRTNRKKPYVEYYGWISWYEGKGPGKSGESSYRSINLASSQKGEMTYAYTDDDNRQLYAITNGSLWRYTGQARGTYTCPCHKLEMPAQKLISWSYVMNGYFEFGDGTKTYGGWRTFGELDVPPDKVLLFAEMPFVKVEGTGQSEVPEGEDTKTDCVLQYDGCGASNPEAIGFNHKSGKFYMAHVSFADGHVAKMFMPRNKNSASDLQELTKWLCTGTEISYDGKDYQEVK